MSGLPLWVLRPGSPGSWAGERWRRPTTKGWAWVAERCGDSADSAQSTEPHPDLPLGSLPCREPLPPPRLSHSSRLGSRFSLRNGRCGPGRGLCQKQEVVFLWAAQMPTQAVSHHWPPQEEQDTELGNRAKRGNSFDSGREPRFCEGWELRKVLEWEVRRIKWHGERAPTHPPTGRLTFSWGRPRPGGKVGL